MPFSIVRNDIIHMKADAIVNTSNPEPVVGSGVDAAIHKAAGPELLTARKVLGILLPGQSAATPAFRLKAKYVLHTSGPVWQGGSHREADILRSCYDSCLSLALEKGCRSVAFPLLATGNYGFPKALALQIAIEAFSAFLLQHEMDIYLVVFNKEAFVLSENLVSSVQSYIDENYVLEAEDAQFSPFASSAYPRSRAMAGHSVESCAEAPLEEMLKNLDAGFSETLLKLIDRTGKKDSEIYNKACVDRKLFSKIRNDPQYHPSKATVTAFCMALELSLDESKDLMKRAGYSLTHSSIFDIIVEFFISSKNYNILELDAVLFSYDQITIASK